MADRAALQEYSNSIRRLRRQCLEAGMSQEEFKKMYFETLTSLENTENNQTSRSKLRIFAYIISICIVIFVTVNNIKSIYSYIACNLQDYIYPGLRILRKLSIPIISLFPSLTHLYHETCLIQNPFFSVVDMDCWPCSSVSNVRIVSDPKPVSEQNSAPFIYQTEQEIIKMQSLEKLYETNKNVLTKETTILMDNRITLQPEEMFDNIQKAGKHTFVWKFNTMNAAIMLRQIISRPKVVPKFGQSTERYVIVDTSQESFKIPDTECSFSFLMSLSGSRVITLSPAEECKQECKSLKVELQESYLLWYNWWYWRPTVQHSSGNSTFIAHVGSYC